MLICGVSNAIRIMKIVNVVVHSNTPNSITTAMGNAKEPNRAWRWLLNGLLFVFYLPMIILASGKNGGLVGLIFKILPIFIILLSLRIVYRRR